MTTDNNDKLWTYEIFIGMIDCHSLKWLVKLKMMKCIREIAIFPIGKSVPLRISGKDEPKFGVSLVCIVILTL